MPTDFAVLANHIVLNRLLRMDIPRERIRERPLANRSDHADIPPTRTIDPIDPPPASDRPTTAMLKGDIDSGRTGDKNPVYDPGLSPLGTDDEAAGTPPSAFRVALARRYENVERWMKGARKTGAAHNEQDGFPSVFVGFIAAAGVVLAVGVWMARAA